MELWLGQACGKDMKVWQLDQALASLNLTRRDILPTLAATLTTISLDDSSLQRFEANT